MPDLDVLNPGEADAFEAALSGTPGGPAPSPEVAALTDLAHSVQTLPVPAPDPGFVASLGSALKTMAGQIAAGQTPTPPPRNADRPPAEQPTAPQPTASGPTASGPPAGTASSPPSATVIAFPRRIPRSLLGAAAGVVVATTAVGVASQSALPGDVLYGVRQVVDGAQVQLAGSTSAQGRVLLDQARDHVSDTGTLADRAQPDPGAIRESLQDAASAVSVGEAKLFDAFDQSRSPDDLAPVRDFTAWVEPQLTALRTKVPSDSLSSLDQLAATVAAGKTTLNAKLVACGAGCAAVAPLPSPTPSTPSTTPSAATSPSASRPAAPASTPAVEPSAPVVPPASPVPPTVTRAPRPTTTSQTAAPVPTSSPTRHRPTWPPTSTTPTDPTTVDPEPPWPTSPTRPAPTRTAPIPRWPDPTWISPRPSTPTMPIVVITLPGGGTVVIGAESSGPVVVIDPTPTPEASATTPTPEASTTTSTPEASATTPAADPTTAAPTPTPTSTPTKWCNEHGSCNDPGHPKG